MVHEDCSETIHLNSRGLRSSVCRALILLLPLFIHGKLWKKPCLFTFSRNRQWQLVVLRLFSISIHFKDYNETVLFFFVML